MGITIIVPSRRLNLPRASEPISYGAPVTISAGGTYGPYNIDQDADGTTPCISVTTTAAVTILNSRLKGRANLIQSVVNSSNITVRNCVGWCKNSRVNGQGPGKFLSLYGPAAFTAENNTWSGGGGVYVDGGAGAFAATLGRIRYNKGRNANSMKSNGSGFDGELGDQIELSNNPLYFQARQSIAQLNNLRNSTNIEIAWNEGINSPYASRVEDNINLYQASGTAGNPILVRDNFIWGAWARRPFHNSYSGGGIIVDGATGVVGDCARYISIDDNIVVAVTNYGIACAHGRDITGTGNRVVSAYQVDGQLASGAPSDRGMYVSGTGQFQDINFDATNSIRWYQAGKFYRNPGSPGSVVLTPTDLGIATLQHERDELAAWHQKLQTAGLTIGSTLTMY